MGLPEEFSFNEEIVDGLKGILEGSGLLEEYWHPVKIKGSTFIFLANGGGFFAGLISGLGMTAAGSFRIYTDIPDFVIDYSSGVKKWYAGFITDDSRYSGKLRIYPK